MAVFKTNKFLPDVFRTDTNKKFLNATIDQLVSEPKLKKINGYIGRKLSPSYNPSDNYIIESDKSRQDYQLEPSLIIKNTVTNNIDFATTYTDIINQIKYNGGLTDKHDRLFDSEYYTYNPKIDLDKFINFSQYYWLENGPDQVTVSSSGVPLAYTYVVKYDSVSKTYKFTDKQGIENPSLTLARGGVYQFVVSDVGNNFWIQTLPGVSGTNPTLPNYSTREVLGVENNGSDNGTIIFSIPVYSAQEEWTSMSVAGSVDFATSLAYTDLIGNTVENVNNLLGGLDGVVTSMDDKTIAFVNNEVIDDQYWVRPNITVDNDIIYIDNLTTSVIPFNDRNNVYIIKIYYDSNGDKRINLIPHIIVNDENKVKVRAGVENTGKEFYSRLGLYHKVPLITASVDTLYYQNSNEDSAFGTIKLVDPATSVIDPVNEIVGKISYTSPNGVQFTNGLKVLFDSNTLAPFNNNMYYVEGVGDSIKLIPVDNLISPELSNNLSTSDYLTINRGSLDQNAWSRSNRWFHMDVIQKTANYRNETPSFDQNLRAQRPIIEFFADYQLYSYGSVAKNPIDILDVVVTDAYTQVQGVVCNNQDYHTFTIDGKDVTLVSGTRVVFTNDINNNVRNKIYNFSIEQTENAPSLTYRAYIQEAEDYEVSAGHTLIVNLNDTLKPLIAGTIDADNNAKQWYYNGVNWYSCQQKTAINQAPLFDVIDKNGISFSDKTNYTNSSFAGTKIFSYRTGTGAVDPIIGIPFSYRNFVTQGDIQFNNDFDSESFVYLLSDGLTETVDVNSGFLQKNIGLGICVRENIWSIAQDFTKQFQVYSFTYDGTTNIFPIDNFPEISISYSNIRVIINNVDVLPENFATTKIADRNAVLVNNSLLTAGDTVFIKIYTKEAASPNAFYEVPTNLDINSLNTNLTTLTLGQMRNHLISLKNSNMEIIGSVPGNSNLRDIQYFKNGGSILQHSAPLIYAGLFLTHPTMNFVNSIRHANVEYNKFKTKFLELSTNPEFDQNNVAETVDAILGIINDIKNTSFPWYYSDMVPYAAMAPRSIPTYSVINPELRSYEITNIFQDKILSNKAVFVYLTRTVDGTTTKKLLIKDKDFYFDQTRPVITFTDSFTLLYGDLIDIVEYDDTTGSYIPETPTKLGLYPKFIPEIFTDNTYLTPIQVLQGHDGSITPCFGDYRDNLLLELERRIYNNIKVEYDTNLFNIDDYVPGKFRVTDYSRQEFDQILSQEFLGWVGTNKVDYIKNNSFKSSDPFTWNYKNFRDVINGESLPGSWRACFKYFYDTDRPHTHPWEMLGFSQKPDWWEDRYGPAPYTGGNEILWSDLSLGYIHSGPRAGFDSRYLRPNLAKIIPVDESGNLRNPSEILVVDYDSNNANVAFAVGDYGSAEVAWRKSSEYPFALQLALALAKPAKYFSLLSNIKNYTRNSVTAQFCNVDTNQHITPTSIKINGNNNGSIEFSAGYLNYIRDYIKSIGIADAEDIIRQNLLNLTVQLSYKMAGFTDKSYINLLAEQSSPSSINDSIVIPPENYRLELFKSSPISKISYSAVIVEKTENGWAVSGYDLANPYFFIIPSLPNNNAYVITSGTQRGVIYKDYQRVKVTIPYGFEFNSTQQVVDFLVSYQRYLVSQGFVFTDTESLLKEEKNWVLSAKEFLHWHEQGWKTNSIIVLSPVSTRLNVYDSTAVVDEITNTTYGSKVVDINFNVIKKNDFTVIRENNLFTIQSNNNQTIALAELRMVQYEHLLILDNQTSFRDIIYLPELGNRQYRLKIIGGKTDLWNGSLELPGFIYSNANIPDWNAGTDYLKGTIVKNKSQYYTALQNITAAEKFQTNQWKLISSDQIHSGLVNNFATNASQSLHFYDIDNQPIDSSMQSFSNGIIGFRNRPYFDNLGIDTVTQTKFYQGMIKQKGTLNAISALQGAVFNNINTNINLYENWAVRVGEYGATDSNQHIEVILDETQITNNPSAIQFIDSSVTAEQNITSYEFKDLYKITGDWNPNLFKIKSNNESDLLQPLPVAGFVNMNDIDATIFNIEDYSTLTTIVNNIGTGFKIWVARDWDQSWNVYRANFIEGITYAMTYDIDSLVKVYHSSHHGLSVGDLVVLKNFSSAFSGVYRVYSIIDTNSFYVTLYQNLESLIAAKTIVGGGILYKLSSMKLNNPSLIDSIVPTAGWITNDKVWVDNLDTNKNWAVYNKIDPWNYSSTVEMSISQYIGNDYFGKSVSITPNGQLLYGGSPGSSTGRVSIFLKSSTDNWTPFGFIWGNGTNLSGFGEVLASSDNFLAVGAPSTNSSRGCVYVFYNQVLAQILAVDSPSPDDKFGASIAISADGRFLYIGCPGQNKVYCYASTVRNEYSQTIYGDGSTSSYSLEYATSKATDLIVTAPFRSSEYIPNSDYTISQFTDGVSTLSGTYDTDTTYFSIVGSTAVDPVTSDTTHSGVTSTGGTGSGAIFNVLRTVGSTSYKVKIVNAGSGYTVGDVLTIKGSLLGGVDVINDLVITVSTITDGTNIIFTSVPINTEKIFIVKRTDYFELLDVISQPTSSGFGGAVACSADGTSIAIGAPNESSDGVINVGATYMYHRTVTKFITDGTSGTYTTPYTFNTVRRVVLDNEVLVEGLDYYIVDTSVQFGSYSVPDKSLILLVDTNQFIFDQKISGDVGANFKFGSALAMCGTGCNVIISSVGYNDSSYRFGMVTRYINSGRVYGSITGTVSNPTVTPGDILIINDYPVTMIFDNLSSVISEINGANIPGVTAENYKNKLKINSTSENVGGKLDIKLGKGTVISDLGLSLYIYGQKIIHPERNGESLGKSVAVNYNSTTLAISSDGADLSIPTTFDSEKTTYDSNSTTIADYIKDSGAVYIYDLMDNPFATPDNPSVFAYTQKLVGPNIQTGYNFGSSIAINGSLMAVGVTNDYNIVANGGSIYTFNNPNQESGWQLLRYKQPRVDIGAVNSAFIYNAVSKLLINYFDYLDPSKGKILGIVEQYLDYKESFDPAFYNVTTNNNTIKNTSFYWTEKYVGKTWWDLSTVSFIDYEQDTLAYRMKNWGSLFPGSQVKIYEWVKSPVPPSQYVRFGGDGIPKYQDDSSYSLITKIDSSTGLISQEYYFWVSDKKSVDPVVSNRSLSVVALEKYITDPRDQGIPYIGLLSPNSVALYNTNDKLSGTNVVLNLNLGKSRSSNLIHNEYELIQEGNPEQIFPEKIITKIKDSLVGFDSQGAMIPDYQLSPQDKIGISVRPRQSVFVDRLAALKNYIDNLNLILEQSPVLLISKPSTLYLEDPLPVNGYDGILNSQAEFAYVDVSTFYDGYTILIPNDADLKNKWSLWQFQSSTKTFLLKKVQSYKTTLYWSSKDWYSSDYDAGTKIDFIVNTYGNIETLILTEGNYIKVLDNGEGNWLIYRVNSDLSLTLKAAQNATIEISTNVYNTTLGSGFDTIVFDLVEFDPQVGLELVNIFDSVYTEILIKDLAIQFNQIFFSLVNYIFSEQKSPDWIFKTSFVDVYHKIRNLEQTVTYIKDNQTFYRDYINEIKPYRTILKDYVPLYNGIDIGTGDWTDFDLPSGYDFATNTYRSLNVDYVGDQELLNTSPYNNWTDHYKYKITSYTIGNPGEGYTIAPNVEIYGGGGGGATAITSIDPITGGLTSVTVLTPGEGFTTTPNIVINGSGSGAVVYPIMNNEYYSPNPADSYNTIRNISTVLTFDRVKYNSANIRNWVGNDSVTYTPTVISTGTGNSNIWISSGNVYVYNNEAYILNSTYLNNNNLFDFTKFTKVESSNVLLNSTDRIFTYYDPSVGMPGKNLNELIDGVDYGGTKVTGAKFTACSFSHTSNVTSFNYQGLTINSNDLSITDFKELGFEIDQPIRIQALVPFDFQNNGYFKIVNVDHSYMTLTGQPIETTYDLILAGQLNLNAGDVITQANNTAKAYVLRDTQGFGESTVVPIIYVNPEFTNNNDLIYINGLITLSYPLQVKPGGNVDVKIDYLELDTSVLDSNIYSTYLDTALGTRPEDINIIGGAYVDVYNSHAPEELVPGRMYDSLEMRVFSNNTANTATYGFRIFQPMSSNIQYTRISANTTTTLSSALAIFDSVIHITDASILPDPNPSNNVPGVVFINGEKIHYYQKYDATKIATSVDWQANTTFNVDTLLNVFGNTYLILGNVYANANVYINSANIQQVYLNSLAQIRRGVDGTGANLVYESGTLVSDSSVQQEIPDGGLDLVTFTGNATATANVTWKLTLSANITANIGDYITQFVGNTGNVRVLDTVTNGNIVAVDITGGNLLLASNIGTRVNIATPISYTSTTANIVSMSPLGMVKANGNVVLNSVSVLTSQTWIPLGVGTGLEGSTTNAAEFIKNETSYIP